VALCGVWQNTQTSLVPPGRHACARPLVDRLCGVLRTSDTRCAANGSDNAAATRNQRQQPLARPGFNLDDLVPQGAAV
jgi:hypothetical protein